MKLSELLREADALTYVNALKVTLTEIKDEVSEIEEMQSYANQGCERVKKLMRKADNQYRLISKMVQQGEASEDLDLTVDPKIDLHEIQAIMEDPA